MSEDALLEETVFSVGKTRGSSPANDTYYIVICFDISDAKKYRLLVRILKCFGSRIQKSVFEATLRPSQIKDLTGRIRHLMASDRYFNEADNVRIYKIAGNCNVTVFGKCEAMTDDDNIFF